MRINPGHRCPQLLHGGSVKLLIVIHRLCSMSFVNQLAKSKEQRYPWWSPYFLSWSRNFSHFMKHENLFTCLQDLPPILSQMNPVYAVPILLIDFNIILSSISRYPKWSLRFHTKTLYVFLLSPIDITWPAHLILLGLNTWIVFCEQYRSLSSSFCSFLHPLLPRRS